MKKYLIGLALLLVGTALAGIPSADKFRLNQHAGSAAHGVRLGNLVDQPGSVSVVWNASTAGFGSSTLNTQSVVLKNDGTVSASPGKHLLDKKVWIPSGSLITRTWIEVTDPPVVIYADENATAATIAFNCSSYVAADDLVVLVTASGNFSTAVGGALLEGVAQDTVALMHRNSSTNKCYPQAVLPNRAYSSGKITLFIEYMQIR